MVRIVLDVLLALLLLTTGGGKLADAEVRKPRRADEILKRPQFLAAAELDRKVK